MKNITNWQDLKDYVNSLTKKQLSQPVQVIRPSPMYLKELMPVLSAGTVEDMELEASRSSVDNRYHAEELVLLCDYNPFGEDGAIAYEYKDMKSIGKSGEFPKGKPVYGKLGKTKEKDQFAPKKKRKNKDVSFSDIQIIKNRIKEL